MHVHRDEAEIFYVLEGAITAWSGSDVLSLEAGGAIYLPPNQPHAFGIHTERARLITVTSPAGFADFVRAAGTPITGDVPTQWEFDLASIMSAAPLHHIEIVGPPLSCPLPRPTRPSAPAPSVVDRARPHAPPDSDKSRRWAPQVRGSRSSIGASGRELGGRQEPQACWCAPRGY